MRLSQKAIDQQDESDADFENFRALFLDAVSAELGIPDIAPTVAQREITGKKMVKCFSCDGLKGYAYSYSYFGVKTTLWANCSCCGSTGLVAESRAPMNYATFRSDGK
jgi:hypothetical protein